MGIPLVVDDNKLAALREFAEANPIPVDEMRRIAAGEAPCVGEREGYGLNLDLGYRLVFTVEEHPQRSGGTKWLRHMSMSLSAPGRAPNQFSLGMIGESLGFPVKNGELDYEKCRMWDEGEGVINAVCSMD